MKLLIRTLIPLIACTMWQITSAQSVSQVIAHRGAWKVDGLPQNSIASLHRAIELGCAGTEFDVHLTKDDVLVVNHDNDFYGIDIATATYAELLAKKHPNGESIPTAEAYLREGMKQQKTRLVFELKTSKLGKERTLHSADLSVALVKRLGAEAYVDYIAFDYDACKRIIELAPNAMVQYLNGDVTPAQAKKDGLRGLDYHFKVYKENPTWIKEAHDLGLVINSWTVNTEDEMRNLLSQQVEFITTDQPALLLDVIKQVSAPAIARQFNVATYNIRYDASGDTGNRWKDRSPHLAQLIKFHGFDLFGTQEGLKHQLDDLLAMLPGYEYIGVGRDDGKERGEHSAIFFRSDRFEAVKKGDFWLAENTTEPNKGWDAALPRICTWGLFKDKQSGFEFFLFNAHFDHVGVEARKESAKLIVEKAHELGAGTPMIIMGDFNVDQDNESYRVLNEGGEVTDAYELAALKYAPSPTFNGFNVGRKGDRRIDHIFLSDPFHVLRYGILTDSYEGKTPSDHFPVVATVSHP